MSVRIPAVTWNELLTDMVPLLRNRIMSITGVGPKNQWRHPWFTTARWDPIAETWLATVKPGLVNGQDVTVSVKVNEETKDVPLVDGPPFPLGNYRAIGTDAVNLDGTGEEVPPFFIPLGVAQPMTFSTTGEGITQEITGLLSEQENQRILRACDIVLRCYRPRSVVDWQITPAVTGSVAQVAVGLSGSSAHKATLNVVSKHAPTPTLADLDLLSGALADPGYDQALIATVYLLSPAGAAYEATPGADWTPYVEHHAFWNADYIAARPVLPARAENLQLNLFGLGGITGAQFTINQILSTSNDATANLLAQLTSRMSSGKISTPGHRRSSVKWDETRSLNPPFPFFRLG
jgi:hypothetical protein